MPQEAHLAQLLCGLRSAVENSGLAARKLSSSIGRNETYVSRLLAGRLVPRVEEVFQLLVATGTDPEEFFAVFFPLGGATAFHFLGGQLGQPSDPSQPWDVRDLMRDWKKRTRWQPPSPREVTRRMGELLRAAIRSKRASQRRISLALGLPQDALGEALRGNSALSFRHVFGVLEAVEVAPTVFFAELFQGNSQLVEGVPLISFLATLDVALAQAAETLERQGQGPAEESLED